MLILSSYLLLPHRWHPRKYGDPPAFQPGWSEGPHHHLCHSPLERLHLKKSIKKTIKEQLSKWNRTTWTTPSEWKQANKLSRKIQQLLRKMLAFLEDAKLIGKFFTQHSFWVSKKMGFYLHVLTSNVNIIQCKWHTSCCYVTAFLQERAAQTSKFRASARIFLLK